MNRIGDDVYGNAQVFLLLFAMLLPAHQYFEQITINHTKVSTSKTRKEPTMVNVSLPGQKRHNERRCAAAAGSCSIVYSEPRASGEREPDPLTKTPVRAVAFNRVCN
jgi:hypothetical protein